MESPLDILSRAAGMVSRNSDSSSGGGSVVVVPSGGINGSGAGSGSNSSSSSSTEQINGVDNHTQCRILKLALVSSNASNSISNNSTSQIQNGTSSKGSAGLGSRGHLQDYTKSESCSPPPVGLRTVVAERERAEKRIVRQREQHDMLSSSDSDTPIDMSMKKVKRKLVTSDSNDEASSDERDRDEKIKRKRPSVISFASHHRMMSNVTGFDVDDHFKKSLGLEFYNSVFSGDKKSSTTPPSRSPVPSTTAPDEIPPEDKKKLFKPKIMASHAKVIKSVNHAPELDNSVDDHFAKALGKSTWMRLQQGL